jgi:Gametolysin peptidase M11
VAVRLLAGCLAVAALVATANAHGAVEGPQRVLVVLATWGPQPFTQEDVQHAAIDGASAFLSNSSYGKATITGTVTPWLDAYPTAPSRCENARALRGPALDAAAASGQTVTGFDRVVYIIPQIPCTFTGRASGDEVWLIGAVWPGLVAHELGHTWGLAHANRCEETSGPCFPVEYGDRYSVMGGRADGQYDAFEKLALGWLTEADVVRPVADGTYSIDQLELPSDLPQALVITTATSEYWLDHREPVLEDAWLTGNPVTGGVFVHGGPNLTQAGGPASSRFGTADALMPNAARGKLDAFLPGDVFSEAGAFKLTVLRHEGTRIDVAFRWTDGVAPSRPAILSPRGTLRGGRISVDWQGSRDTGSGIARYEVRVDRGPRVLVENDFRIGEHASLPRPAAGTHVVRVVAIDRAGNRSAPGESRFTVARKKLPAG